MWAVMNAHQSEDDDGEYGCPETGVDREDDELKNHLPGARDNARKTWKSASNQIVRSFTS